VLLSLVTLLTAGCGGRSELGGQLELPPDGSVNSGDAGPDHIEIRDEGVAPEGASGDDARAPDGPGADVTASIDAGDSSAPDPSAVGSYLVNPAHTSSISDPSLHAPLARAWTVDLGAPASYPLMAEGRVYVLAGADPTRPAPSQLFALEAASGEALWGPVDAGEAHAHALDAGRLVTVDKDGAVKAFDAATGSAVWSARAADAADLKTIITAYRGIAYVATQATLYAFDMSNGAELWKDPLQFAGGVGAPTVGEEGVFLDYPCHNTYGFDRVTGAQLWSQVGPCASSGGATAALFGGKLYERDINANTIFDAKSGQVLGFVVGNPLAPAFDESTLYLVTQGALRAYSQATLEPRWSFEGDGALSTAPLVVDGEVYVASSNGNLFGLDAASGAQNWSDAVGAPLVSEAVDVPGAFGMAATGGHLIVPAGSKLLAYSSQP